MSPSSPQARTSSAAERLVRVEPVQDDCSEDLLTKCAPSTLPVRLSAAIPAVCRHRSVVMHPQQ